MENKILQIDEEETLSENEEASVSSKGSDKKSEIIGKGGKPENQI